MIKVKTLKYIVLLSFFLFEGALAPAQKMAGGFASPESVISNGKKFGTSQN